MKKKIIITILCSVTIILIVTGVILLKVSNSSYVKVDYIEAGIRLSSKQYSIIIKFSDIDEVDTADTIYNNKRLDGIKWNNCEVGIFENETYGNYYSYVSKKSKLSVVIKISSSDRGTYYVIVGLLSKNDSNELYNYLIINTINL